MIRETGLLAAPASKKKFRKPGPATSARTTPSISPARSSNSPATCRGGRPSFEAKTIATLDAQSPWLPLRGRSRRTCTSATPSSATAPSSDAAIRSVGSVLILLRRSCDPSEKTH